MRPPLKYDCILFAVKGMKSFVISEGGCLSRLHQGIDEAEKEDNQLKLTNLRRELRQARIMFEAELDKHIALVSYLLSSNPKDELLPAHKKMMREEIGKILRNLPSSTYKHQLVPLLTEGPLAETESENDD